MSDLVKQKTVSYSQFSNWYICPHKWMRDYILKEKEFEDNLIMSFGTAIHETVQMYLTILYTDGDETAAALDLMTFFTAAFKQQIEKKSIPHTPEEFNEFIEDGKNILKEFCDPVNRLRYFPSNKWELLAIEDPLNVEIKNNIKLNGYIDIVLREKTTGNIRIVDFKTSNRGWTKYEKDDYTKNAQLQLYKALYSKQHNIPLNKIVVEFIILRRKIYENCNYDQNRISSYKPSAHLEDIHQVIREFSKFVDAAFTKDGFHNVDAVYPKIPGKNRKNCKYCQYLKSRKCDGIPDVIK